MASCGAKRQLTPGWRSLWKGSYTRLFIMIYLSCNVSVRISKSCDVTAWWCNNGDLDYGWLPRMLRYGLLFSYDNSDYKGQLAVHNIRNIWAWNKFVTTCLRFRIWGCIHSYHNHIMLGVWSRIGVDQSHKSHNVLVSHTKMHYSGQIHFLFWVVQYGICEICLSGCLL